MHPDPPMLHAGTTSLLADALAREHRALARAVAGVRKELADDPTSLAVRGELVALLRHLEAHFEYEEEGGYMDAVLELAPHRGDEVAALRAEHDRLREAFAALVDGERLDEHAPEDVRARANAALESLAEHERRENALVQETLLRESGGG